MATKTNKKANVPNLRFPGFEGEWEAKKLGDLLEFKNGINASREQYGRGVRFINVLDILNNDYITYDRIVGQVNVDPAMVDKYSVRYGDILFQRSSETREEVGSANVYLDKNQTATFGGFVIRGRKIGNYDPVFFNKLLKTNVARDEITSKSGGSTRYNVGQEILASVSLRFPSLSEQGKISLFLTVIDKRIQTQNKIIEGLKSLKNIVRYQLFNNLFLNQDVPTLQVKDILEYEQPGKYIVSSEDYKSDNSLIPVLTANKGFILGYTQETFGIYDKGECIIFDDFTLDMKYVDFPFKVKSSAIKILKAVPSINLKFIFEYLVFLNMSSTDHKRHYISEIAPMELCVPKYKLQDQIARLLTTYDYKLKTEKKIYNLLFRQKDYLQRQLFI